MAPHAQSKPQVDSAVIIGQLGYYVPMLVGFSTARRETNGYYLSLNEKAVALIVVIIGGAAFAVTYLAQNGFIVNGDARFYQLMLVWVATAAVIFISLLCKLVNRRNWKMKIQDLICRTKQVLRVINNVEASGSLLELFKMEHEYVTEARRARKTKANCPSPSAAETDLDLPELMSFVHDLIILATITTAVFTTIAFK